MGEGGGEARKWVGGEGEGVGVRDGWLRAERALERH